MNAVALSITSTATSAGNLAILRLITAPNVPMSGNIGGSFVTAPKSALTAYMLTAQALVTLLLMKHVF
jgi:hypothetical protein